MPDIHHPHQVARSGVIYTGTLVFQKILSFAYFAVLARALGPAILGRYTFVLSFAAFFSLAVDFGLVALATRTFAQAEANKEKEFRVFLTARLLTLGLGLILLFGSALVLGYDAQLLTLLSISALIMVMDTFTAFFYALFRAEQNLLYESLGTAVFQIIIFTAGLIAIRRTHSLIVLLAVISLGSLWHVLYSWILVKAKTRFSFKPLWDWVLLKRQLTVALPFFLAAGFIKAYNTIDTIMVQRWSGELAVGFYSIPNKIVFSFPFIALGITAAVYPAMANYAVHSQERLQAIFSRTLQLLLAVSLPISVGIWLLARPIITRIWPAFSDAIPALEVLIWAVVFLYIEFPFGSLLNATGHERANTINRCIQLGSYVLLNALLIPAYGFMGAIYSSLFTSFLIVFLGWLRARKLIIIFTKDMVLGLVKLIISAGLMGVLIYYLRPHFNFLLIIPAAGLFYLLMIFLLRVYGRADWQWLKSLRSQNAGPDSLE